MKRTAIFDASRDGYWVLLLVLLGALLRLPHIAEPSLYLDESFSIWYSQQRLGPMLEAIGRDTNPPLHFVLLKYWMELFGNGHVPARVLSAVLNLATIPLIVSVGKRHFGRFAAFFAATWWVVSDIQIHFSQEARTYALTVFLSVLAIGQLLNWLESGQKKSLIFLALANLGLLLSHYATIYLLVAQVFISLLFIRNFKTKILPLAVSAAGTLLLFLPWFLYFRAKFKTPDTWAAPLDADYLQWVVIRWLAAPELLWILPGILLASLLGWLLKPKGKGGKGVLILALWAVFPFLLAVSVSFLLVPVLKPNYLLYITPALFLLTGKLVWISGFPLWIRGVFAGVILFFALQYVHTEAHRGWDWEALATEIKFTQMESTVVLGPIHDFHTFAYYFDNEAFRDYRHTVERLEAKKVLIAEKWETINRIDLEAGVKVVCSEMNLGDPEFTVTDSLNRLLGEPAIENRGDFYIMTYPAPGTPENNPAAAGPRIAEPDSSWESDSIH